MAIFGRHELAKLPFSELPFSTPVGPVEGSPTAVKGLDGWPEHEYQRKVRFQVEMMESALEPRQSSLVIRLARLAAEIDIFQHGGSQSEGPEPFCISSAAIARFGATMR